MRLIRIALTPSSTRKLPETGDPAGDCSSKPEPETQSPVEELQKFVISFLLQQSLGDELVVHPHTPVKLHRSLPLDTSAIECTP